jgi:hypothetical protein
MPETGKSGQLRVFKAGKEKKRPEWGALQDPP